MRLEQFESLIEIANSNSISIAAQNLYISQPALSRSIKGLEDELGIPLLSRTVDGVRLTPEGEALIPYMQTVMADLYSLKQKARQLKSSPDQEALSGTFQLYTIPVIADSLLPLLLEECSHRFPAMKVHTSMLSMSKLPDLIIPEDADLILGINISGLLDSSIQKSGLFMEPLFTGNSYLVVGKNHPLAHKKITTRSEMLEQQLIIHYNGFDLDLLYNALLDTPHPVNVLFRSNNTRLITQTLEKQEVALLTNNLLLQMDYIKNPNLSVIPIKNSRNQYFCLFREDHPHLAFIQELIDSLKAIRTSPLFL